MLHVCLSVSASGRPCSAGMCSVAGGRAERGPRVGGARRARGARGGGRHVRPRASRLGGIGPCPWTPRAAGWLRSGRAPGGPAARPGGTQVQAEAPALRSHQGRPDSDKLGAASICSGLRSTSRRPSAQQRGNCPGKRGTRLFLFWGRRTCERLVTV